MEIDIFHIVVNFVGGMAVFFLLLSPAVSDAFCLRFGLIVSSMWFILYGALISSYELIITAVMMGVINSWKLYGIIKRPFKDVEPVDLCFTYDNKPVKKFKK